MNGVVKHNTIKRVLPLKVGQDSSVGIATRYELDDLGIESWGARFSAPIQTGPGVYPAFYTSRYQFFPRGKAAGAWH